MVGAACLADRTLDSTVFGGDIDFGKQHGKYIVSDNIGFVGTTNFDYPSRLYNNEMGSFFKSKSLEGIHDV